LAGFFRLSSLLAGEQTVRTKAMNNIHVIHALLAAALFGASTPFAKLLVGEMSPWLLAGLLYLVALPAFRALLRPMLPASAA